MLSSFVLTQQYIIAPRIRSNISRSLSIYISRIAHANVFQNPFPSSRNALNKLHANKSVITNFDKWRFLKKFHSSKNNAFHAVNSINLHFYNWKMSIGSFRCIYLCQIELNYWKNAFHATKFFKMHFYYLKNSITVRRIWNSRSRSHKFLSKKECKNKYQDFHAVKSINMHFAYAISFHNVSSIKNVKLCLEFWKYVFEMFHAA